MGILLALLERSRSVSTGDNYTVFQEMHGRMNGLFYCAYAMVFHIVLVKCIVDIL